MDTKQIRFCKSIECDKLDHLECKVGKCINTDKSKAIKKCKDKLKEAKHGGNS